MAAVVERAVVPPAPHLAGLTVRRVPIATLHHDPANVRTHDDRNLATITASLKTFGQVEPLVIQKSTGKVIGGNGRLTAMLAIGIDVVDIVELDVDNLTATALAITLNRSSDLSSFDEIGLVAVLRSLQSESFDLDAIGFTGVEVDALCDKLGTDALKAAAPSTAALTLAERFVIPPFSVLDARQGYWQERKKAWLALGIQSELGRGGAEGLGAAVPGEGGKTAIYRKGASFKYESTAEPSRAEPSRAEPSRAEPSRAEPSRAEPSRAEPSRAE